MSHAQYTWSSSHFVLFYIIENKISSNLIGAVHILRLLQYYSFERKMEGYDPFTALNQVKSYHFILVNVGL